MNPMKKPTKKIGQQKMQIHPDTKWMFSLLDNPDSWIHGTLFRDFRNQIIKQILTQYPVSDEDRKVFDDHPEIYGC